MAGTTVTVACKIPNGLALRIMEAYVDNELVMGGGTREVTKHREVGDPVRIKGNSAPNGTMIVTHGGYALTTGISADFWELWFEQNKDSALVKNNLIYALPREDSAASKGREMEEVTSGQERIDPSKPVKLGHGMAIQSAKA